MGRPVIGRPPVKVAPTQTLRPPPRRAGTPAQLSPELAAAKQAVEDFEKQYQLLQRMRLDWEAQFPEALEALNEVRQQEDIVENAIKRAKPLVATAHVTVGEFKAQRKWDAAHYDGEEITRILAQTPRADKIFLDMLTAGILEAVALNRDASLGWFAQHPDYATIFNKAFVEETETTTAVTVPKV